MQLHVYQSIWGMERLPWRGSVPWTPKEQMKQIVEAGFDGVSVSFADTVMARRICSLAVGRGLRIEATCFPTSVEGLPPVFEAIEDIGRDHVDHVNLQPNVRPRTVVECVPYLEGWQQLGEEAAIPVYVETHRDRMTTDLFFTLDLLAAVPTLKLTADLSHFVVGREFAWPVDEVNHELIRTIMRHSRAYHGRVASREQVQIQPSFPHHEQWVNLFAEWWEWGFRSFRAAAPPDAILTFTTELGPPQWYAMSGPDGEELSDRWSEALQLKGLAEEIWSRSQDEAPTGP
jgi:hypothetical protein